MSLIILQVIPSLIGYILTMVTFNCVTWSFFPEQSFRRWAKLTSIFLIISFFSWTTSLISSLCHICGSNNLSLHHSFCLMSSLLDGLFIVPRQNLSWSPSIYWLVSGYQSNSWWEIPSFPLDDCVIIDNVLDFLPTQTWFCLVIPYVPR